MATFHEYKCPKCGFEIQTAEDYYYWLSLGTYVNAKCANCGDVSPVRIAANYLAEKDKGFKAALERFVYINFNSTCRNCARTGDFVLWEPKNGCPKCGSPLEDKGFIMVD